MTYLFLSCMPQDRLWVVRMGWTSVVLCLFFCCSIAVSVCLFLQFLYHHGYKKWKNVLPCFENARSFWEIWTVLFSFSLGLFLYIYFFNFFYRCNFRGLYLTKKKQKTSQQLKFKTLQKRPKASHTFAPTSTSDQSKKNGSGFSESKNLPTYTHVGTWREDVPSVESLFDTLINDVHVSCAPLL